MEDKILDQFVEKLKKLNIPTYCIGRIRNKDDSTRFFEVVIKRPDKYNKPELLKKIPNTFRGFKVKVV